MEIFTSVFFIPDVRKQFGRNLGFVAYSGNSLGSAIDAKNLQLKAPSNIHYKGEIQVWRDGKLIDILTESNPTNS